MKNFFLTVKQVAGFTTTSEAENESLLSFLSSAVGAKATPPQKAAPFTTTNEKPDEPNGSSAWSAVGAKSQSGFTLLYAIIVVAVVLSIGITIAGIYQRETILTASSVASTKAFYAADAGLECAMYYDVHEDAFSPTSSASTISCADQNSNVDNNPPESGADYDVTFDNGTIVCGRIIIYKGSDPKTRIESRGRNTCAASQHPAERALRTAY